MTKAFKCIKNVDGDLWLVFVKEAKARNLTVPAFFEEVLKFYFKHNPLLSKGEKNNG
jgi:hypothetical protein